MSSDKRFRAQSSRIHLGPQAQQGVLNVDVNLWLLSSAYFEVFALWRNWPEEADDAARSRRKQLMLFPPLRDDA